MDKGTFTTTSDADNLDGAVKPEEVRVLKLPDAHLTYARRGSGAGVLLIQGVGAIGAVWRPQTDALSKRYSTIAFDNRGIGASRNLSGALSIEAMATDALAIMEAEGLDQFHVVGHSMGGLIAQEVALCAPGRVKSLSLLCTFARGTQAARLTPAMIFMGMRTRIGTRAMRRSAFLELVVPPAVLASRGAAVLGEEMGRLFGRDLADQPPIIMKQVQAMRRYDPSSRLGSLAAIPTLVVSGELDRIALPRFGHELAASIPGARYVALPGAAHGVPVQDAPLINRLLSEHLAHSERQARSTAEDTRRASRP
jgi:pimeloyl-ACP methyl ester carboxylesterase